MPIKTDSILSWATDVDDKTMEQAQRSASLPFVQPYVALMPDAHFGYGSTVGSVIPTHGAIIPSAVGVDIGCGMIAARLNLTAADLPDDLARLHTKIANAVPAGVGKGHGLADDEAIEFSQPSQAQLGQKWWTTKLITTAQTQFGSLGSGNHFVEVCLDEIDRVWIVLHSGSRGVGNQLANIHIDGAKALMKRYFIDLPDPDLAYLVESSDEFSNYIRDMLWAQEYAMGSRKRMMHLVHAALVSFIGHPVGIVDTINCHHNFTAHEHHGGKNVWITRKGAIRARFGDRGVIPGSMGAASFIVTGKGSAASFCSCSHGAGRKMSRGQARRELDRESLVEAMTGKAWNGDAETLIDEDPRAYKNIDEVMAAQTDLVTIEHTLHQVLNYKGT
jgi:tRNA-splicing ligase RtcB